ncbi:hypothetical protein Vc3S01_A0103 [Vibrio campbellii]|nr:hypothetical protein Vc3S01_A0103 [Vibrio campbellii]EDL69929.1 hypothetical protein A1Q_4042 [Vibrio campbellii HY01]
MIVIRALFLLTFIEEPKHFYEYLSHKESAFFVVDSSLSVSSAMMN